jgi:hypothetical protein
MNDKQIMLTKQIMLIENNPDDRDLTIRALKKRNILNPVLALRTRPCRPCRCRPVHVVARAVGGVRRGSPGWSRTRGNGR